MKEKTDLSEGTKQAIPEARVRFSNLSSLVTSDRQTSERKFLDLDILFPRWRMLGNAFQFSEVVDCSLPQSRWEHARRRRLSTSRSLLTR
jgi:hypothetical protein